MVSIFADVQCLWLCERGCEKFEHSKVDMPMLWCRTWPRCQRSLEYQAWRASSFEWSWLICKKMYGEAHRNRRKPNACGDRNFGHTACIVYVDVCQRSMNHRMRLKISFDWHWWKQCFQPQIADSRNKLFMPLAHEWLSTPQMTDGKDKIWTNQTKS